MVSGQARRSRLVSPCADPQQRQTPRQGHLQVRSGLTLSVSVQNIKKLSIHQAFPVQTSGQLRFLNALSREGRRVKGEGGAKEVLRLSHYQKLFFPDEKPGCSRFYPSPFSPFPLPAIASCDCPALVHDHRRRKEGWFYPLLFCFRFVRSGSARTQALETGRPVVYERARPACFSGYSRTLCTTSMIEPSRYSMRPTTLSSNSTGRGTPVTA